MKWKLLLWCIWFRARSSLVLLVYLLEDIARKNHLLDHCFPLMSFWRFRGIVFQIPRFPSVCAETQKKLTRHLDFDRLNFFVTSYISWWFFFFYFSSLCGNFFYPLLPVAQMTIKNVCASDKTDIIMMQKRMQKIQSCDLFIDQCGVYWS